MSDYRPVGYDPNDPYPPFDPEFPTEAIDRPDAAPRPRGGRPARVRRSAVGRALQAFSGAVAAGVVLLALVVVVTAWLGGRRGFPGPGAVSVGAHVAAAVVVVLAQRFADHRRGVVALGGSVAVFFVTALLLWTQWWG